MAKFVLKGTIAWQLHPFHRNVWSRTHFLGGPGGRTLCHEGSFRWPNVKTKRHAGNGFCLKCLARLMSHNPSIEVLKELTKGLTE